ncbi:hypothetical protein HH303_01525 [Rhodospirillaceae bacterium KN72]|uniref:Uncharacterized protein n=1 Tax=Pacificispira spongiicola TaxID=2729598 RepID=A0A7Y0DWZ5_9PROT|nr:hypothetical protein [Pacificispira spongiicola]NMM43138.1 hypothetical protein [Pacificispira spongiicola]
MSAQPTEPEQHPASNHKALVAVVVFLGVLIVLGLGGLVYGLMTRTGKSEVPQTVTQTIEPAKAANTPALADLPGRRVVGMTAADGILYLHVLDDDGQERIRAYDSGGGLLFEVDPYPAVVK